MKTFGLHDAADFLNISIDTMKDFAQNGIVPGAKIGKSWVFIDIKTAYCYQYFYGDNAILKYDAYAGGNMLIFSSGASCAVESVFK